MPSSSLARLVIGTLLLMAPLVEAADEKEAASFSPANQLLFLDDHLTDVEYPARYHYRFSSTGTADSFNDTIVMDTHNNDDQTKQVHVEYFSGDRQRHIPDIASAKGNPIIMLFLQRDVSEMSSRTGGNWRYFQKQIKLALENAARIEPVTLRYNGSDVAGQRITLQPFADERTHRNEMAAYLDKTYSFLLAEAIPGDVYEMQTTLPANDGGQPVVEHLILDHVEPLKE
ncbi:hypothetical protein [Modicisalibacter luteus]|uniref:Secreted protein n=1 Tax=Modicisalibacter luteus TaxID=453962 RepID=A0ABV7LY88_9GAMM|nr:hypothetical protein [Halomonas lutea]GHB01553.1 hypothetical protein GCM10007159_24250 [Halomonas lutea]